MRGELDDALARMARMERLQRRRAAEAPDNQRSGLDDLVEAVRRVVAQHPGVRVTLWAEDGVQGAGVRVEWSGGEVVVSADDQPLPMPSAGAPPDLPPDAAPPDLPSPDAPTDLPSAGTPPGQPNASTTYRSLPVPPPSVWVPAPASEQDTNESAARLAELIRRDPDLLRAPDDPHQV
ncbi:hypothetical protein [Plantactinospora sp. GCM10030261]|uniref:hypothetical protein n=1 Tax=Plantactinospora sp. GCM10030261 TaxID=3273420 RepID=UPI003614DCA2